MAADSSFSSGAAAPKSRASVVVYQALTVEEFETPKSRCAATIPMTRSRFRLLFLGADRGFEAEFSDRGQDGLDVFAGEGFGRGGARDERGEGLALEGAPDHLDDRGGQMGNAAEGGGPGRLAATDGPAEEDGLVGLSAMLAPSRGGAAKSLTNGNASGSWQPNRIVNVGHGRAWRADSLGWECNHAPRCHCGRTSRRSGEARTWRSFPRSGQLQPAGSPGVGGNKPTAPAGNRPPRRSRKDHVPRP
ncbi:MAG: hypothetical protein DIJKHBIC_04664 [Thermoanaerobaculia bacterium]|nr:hypothetical protein [Thermoanaerobaculia bacterium]